MGQDNAIYKCSIKLFFSIKDKTNQSCRYGLDKYITFIVSVALICLVPYLLCCSCRYEIVIEQSIVCKYCLPSKMFKTIYMTVKSLTD